MGRLHGPWYKHAARVVHWDTLDDSLAFKNARGRLDNFELVMHLHFNLQVEDMFELTNGKCHAFTFEYARGGCLSLLMASVICLLFSMQEENILAHTNGTPFCIHCNQLVDQFEKYTFTQ